MSGVVTPRYINLDINDFYAKKLATHINPNSSLTKVPIDSQPMMMGNCYWNSEYRAKTQGGEIVFGWMFLHWKNVCIEAVHHAVWKMPNGQLLDVTENPLGKHQRFCIFLQDDSSKIGLDQVLAVTSKFQPTKQNGLFKKYVEAYKEKQRLTREINELYFSNGYRCEYQRKAAGFDVSFHDAGFTGDAMYKNAHLRSQLDQAGLINGELIKLLNKA